jgi:hypothetical protein
MYEHPGSWLALVAFCAVTTLTVALGLGVLFAGGSVAFAVAQSHASAETQPDTPQFSSGSGYREAVEADVSRSSQLRQVDDDGASKTFAGIITDSHCGARHSMKSGKSSAECARSCVRNGAHYVLVDGDRNHPLDGNSKQFEALAGERVEVVGMLEGDTIKVKTVASR